MTVLKKLALAFWIVWIVLAILTLVDRMPYSCGALLDAPCIAAGWKWSGDLVLFTWVEDWETLVGSFAALLAALLGASAIRRQMRQAGEHIRRQLTHSENIAREQRDQAERHREDGRRRKLLGLQATLPHALSAASGHLSQVASNLRKLHASLFSLEAAQLEPFTVPGLPSEIVPVFQSVIELEDDAGVRDQVIKILSELQVLQANLMGLYDSGNRYLAHPDRYEVETVCFRTCVASGMVDILYNYARGTNEFGNNLGTAIWNAAGLLGLKRNQQMQYVRELLITHFGPDPSTQREFRPGLAT